jgi:hypothetical protein
MEGLGGASIVTSWLSVADKVYASVSTSAWKRYEGTTVEDRTYKLYFICSEGIKTVGLCVQIKDIKRSSAFK